MRFEAFTATILSNGVPLEEYKMEVEGRQAKCYVVSEAGKTFSVKLEEELSSPVAPRSSCGYLFLDDKSVGGMILDRGNPSATLKGRLASYTTEQPFAFAEIQTSDRDEDHALDSSVGAGFGTIVLKICRGQRGSEIVQPTFASNSLANDSLLHELAVKKLKVTQRATLGAPVATPRQNFAQFNLLDPVSSPFITFTFVYRSKTMLQALGVIEYKPVDASPPPAAGPSSGARAKRPAQEFIDISSDTDDEDPDVVKAAKELAEAKKRAKQRKGGSPVDKKPKLENGEIIHLD
ncbi:hypothetical protein BDY24DRAFT_380250 [Mrakia frigida]|uniref:uncharacterized protein n=1 Tax=Mrakia frigida TaxID=29902 RepID=UPI003FCC1501